MCAFRLKSVPTTVSTPLDLKKQDEDKDKPKKKVFATTLPPKTGAMYKEAYKEKLRKEKEETATPVQQTRPDRISPGKIAPNCNLQT